MSEYGSYAICISFRLLTKYVPLIHRSGQRKNEERAIIGSFFDEDGRMHQKKNHLAEKNADKIFVLPIIVPSL